MSAPEPREADTLAAVETFNEAFDRQDVDGVMECMTDDCGLRWPWQSDHIARPGGSPPGGVLQLAVLVTLAWIRLGGRDVLIAAQDVARVVTCL